MFVNTRTRYDHDILQDCCCSTPSISIQGEGRTRLCFCALHTWNSMPIQESEGEVPQKVEPRTQTNRPGCSGGVACRPNHPISTHTDRYFMLDVAITALMKTWWIKMDIHTIWTEHKHTHRAEHSQVPYWVITSLLRPISRCICGSSECMCHITLVPTCEPRFHLVIFEVSRCLYIFMLSL